MGAMSGDNDDEKTPSQKHPPITKPPANENDVLHKAPKVPINATALGVTKFRLGNIHIQSATPHAPRYYHRELPMNIASHKNKVLVVDTLVGTGNRARMALHVLLDHHVKEENICFVCLVSSYSGIQSLARFFPKCKVKFY